MAKRATGSTSDAAAKGNRDKLSKPRDNRVSIILGQRKFVRPITPGECSKCLSVLRRTRWWAIEGDVASASLRSNAMRTFFDLSSQIGALLT